MHYRELWPGVPCTCEMLTKYARHILHTHIDRETSLHVILEAIHALDKWSGNEATGNRMYITL